MSNVPKSQRNESTVAFLKDITEMREMLLHTLSYFPKGWYPSITQNLAALGRDAYHDAVAGNSVYLGEGTLEQDFQLRHRYFMRATATLSALGAELGFCLQLVDKGNNFFKSKKQYMYLFHTCSRLCYSGRDKIRKVISSDKKRWQKIEAKQKAK